MTPAGQEKIAQARKSYQDKKRGGNKLQQYAIAQYTGYSTNTVGSFLRGCGVYSKTMFKIAEFLGAELEEGIDYVTEQKVTESLSVRTYSSLPERQHHFVGREEELAKLSSFLKASDRRYIRIIHGSGGTGKTTLVLEAAYLHSQHTLNYSIINEEDRFEAVIFVSAKLNALSASGIIDYEPKSPFNSLQDIIHKISQTLNDETIIKASPEDLIPAVYRSLAKQRTLLIIDNMEVIDEPEEIYNFLNEVPVPTKVVITTRTLVAEPININAVLLKNMTVKDSNEYLNVLRSEFKSKLPSELNWEKVKSTLVEKFQGVPAAYRYSVSGLASGRSLEEIVGSDDIPPDIAQYCFDSQINPIRDHLAYELLLTLAVFPSAPFEETLVSIFCSFSGQSQSSVKEAINKLVQLSFVYKEEKRCKILPLDREFSLSELRRFENNEIKNSIFKEYIKWHLRFAKQHGGLDSEYWTRNHRPIQTEWSNLKSAINWCLELDDYYSFRDFIKKLSPFASINGFWDIRCGWLTKLVDLSEIHRDFQTTTWALVEMSYTFILKGDYDRAEKLLDEANATNFKLGNINLTEVNQDNLDITISQLHNRGLLSLRRGNYDESESYLNMAEEHISASTLDHAYKTRRLTSILFTRAELEKARAELEKARGELEKAYYSSSRSKELFQEVKAKAIDIEWHRRLIDVELYLLQSRLEDNDPFCITDIEVQLNRSLDCEYKLGIAKAKYLYALFFKSHILSTSKFKQEDFEKARRYADDALNSYIQLGMEDNISAVATLISRIKLVDEELTNVI